MSISKLISNIFKTAQNKHNQQTCAVLCVHTLPQSLMRQMANDWRMNQTVRVIFRCNGAVNDSAVLECCGILHKLQCMHYQLV